MTYATVIVTSVLTTLITEAVLCAVVAYILDRKLKKVKR